MILCMLLSKLRNQAEANNGKAATTRICRRPLSCCPRENHQEDIFEGDRHESKFLDRDTAIVNIYQSGGYTLKVIGDYFDLHYIIESDVLKTHKSKT